MGYLPPGSTPVIALSEQQKNVIKICASGLSIFFTGKAGTGKSLVLQKLKELNIKGIFFTAYTGVKISCDFKPGSVDFPCFRERV
jgi:hypothetical protein